MSTDAAVRFTDLDGEAFARLVARTWREYGREVVRPPADTVPGLDGDPAAPIEGGAVFVDRSGDRRIVLTHPGGDRLSAGTLLGVLSLVESPTELLVVSAAGFETGALSVGDAYGVELVGPATVARLREAGDDHPGAQPRREP